MSNRGKRARSSGPVTPVKREQQERDVVTVHVPIVHGIGVDSEASWAHDSVGRVEAWLLNGSRREWAALPCRVERCSPSEHHRHLRADADRVEVILDPICWGKDLPLPSKARTSWWVTRAAFQTIFLYVIAGWMRRMGRSRPNEVAWASPLQQLRPQAMTRAFGWVLRSVLDVVSFTVFSMALALSSLVIVPLLACAACTPKGNRHLGHPMAWTNDDDSHLAIREVVRARLKAVQCDRQVRVGHSQGGSILAELLPPGRSSDRPWTVTLGSGHALLVALNEGRRDTRTVAALLLGMLLFMMAGVFAFVVLPSLPALVLSIQGMLAATLALGTGLWTSLSDPRLSLALQLQYMSTWPDHLEDLGAAMTRATAFDSGPILTLILASVLPVVWVTINRHRLERIAGASDLQAPGFDLVATHDPVSSMLAAQPALARVTVIPQMSSVALDHVRYFENEPFVLRPIEEAIVAAAKGRSSASVVASTVTAEMLHDTHVGLTGARWVRALAPILAAGTVVSATTLMRNAGATGLLVLAACLGIAYGMSAPTVSLRRANRLARLTVSDRDCELALRKGRRRSLTTWVAGLAAIPMVAGANLPPAALSVGIPQPPLALLAPICTFAASLLIIGAFTSRHYGAAGPPLVVAGYALAAAAWVGQANVGGAVVAVICLAAAAATWQGQRRSTHRVEVARDSRSRPKGPAETVIPASLQPAPIQQGAL